MARVCAQGTEPALGVANEEDSPERCAPVAAGLRQMLPVLKLGGPLNDQPCPVVRAEDNSVTPGPRAGPGGAGQPDLAEERRQQYLHFVKRERHSQTDPVAAAEGKP